MSDSASPQGEPTSACSHMALITASHRLTTSGLAPIKSARSAWCGSDFHAAEQYHERRFDFVRCVGSEFFHDLTATFDQLAAS